MGNKWCNKCNDYIWGDHCHCREFFFYHPSIVDEGDWCSVWAKCIDSACHKIMELLFEDEPYNNETEKIKIKDHGTYQCYGEYSIDYYSRKLEPEKETE